MHHSAPAHILLKGGKAAFPQLCRLGDSHNHEIPLRIQADLLTKQGGIKKKMSSPPCSCELELGISSKVTDITKQK